METSSDSRAISLEPISTKAQGFTGSTNLDELPLYLEDVSVGDRWFSPTREVTAEDVADFAMLTGDNDPLHSEDGNESPFGKPVAHGLLGLSLLAGLSTEAPKVATLALVSISEWQFEAPIFFGDEIRVSNASRIDSATWSSCRSSELVATTAKPAWSRCSTWPICIAGGNEGSSAPIVESRSGLGSSPCAALMMCTALMMRTVLMPAIDKNAVTGERSPCC